VGVANKTSQVTIVNFFFFFFLFLFFQFSRLSSIIISMITFCRREYVVEIIIEILVECTQTRLLLTSLCSDYTTIYDYPNSVNYFSFLIGYGGILITMARSLRNSVYNLLPNNSYTCALRMWTYLLWPKAPTNIEVQSAIELVYSIISGVRSCSTSY